MITLNSIDMAFNERLDIEDDYWGKVITEIQNHDDFAEESLSEKSRPLIWKSYIIFSV